MQQLSDLHWQYFKLYIWTAAREKAAEYLKRFESLKSVFCSNIMKVNSAIHETHSAGLIQNLEVFFIDLIIANNEINKKPKSNHIHHVGAEAQQLWVQADAKNKNGVAKQWIVHKVLADAPIISEFIFNFSSNIKDYKY